MPAAKRLTNKGMAILYNGEVSVVLDTQHRTPGNLRAFVQASIRSIRSGKSSDIRFSFHGEGGSRADDHPAKWTSVTKTVDDFVFSDSGNVRNCDTSAGTGPATPKTTWWKTPTSR